MCVEEEFKRVCWPNHSKRQNIIRYINQLQYSTIKCKRAVGRTSVLTLYIVEAFGFHLIAHFVKPFFAMISGYLVNLVQVQVHVQYT